MVEFLGYTTDDLFAEAVEVAREQGATSQEQWDDVVEAVIDDHREFEEIHDDEETITIIATLRGRWPEYQATL